MHLVATGIKILCAECYCNTLREKTETVNLLASESQCKQTEGPSACHQQFVEAISWKQQIDAINWSNSQPVTLRSTCCFQQIDSILLLGRSTCHRKLNTFNFFRLVLKMARTVQLVAFALMLMWMGLFNMLQQFVASTNCQCGQAFKKLKSIPPSRSKIIRPLDIFPWL